MLYNRGDIFKWEPSEIYEETGKEGKLVHYGIKSKDGCMYIGHDEIERIIREIDAFVEFKCSFSLNSPKAQTERSFVVAESYTKGANDNG